MPAGLKVYKEDGNLLFDTENITYGLLKSGYMSLITTWPRLEYRSADLDPSAGSSYAESSFVDGIHGFSVTGAVAPIVFINGRGISCAGQPVSEPQYVRVEVPVQVPCRVPEVAIPAWAAAGLRKTDSLEVKVRALLAERRQRIGYEKQMSAALLACHH